MQIKEKILSILDRIWKNLWGFSKWVFVAILVGIIVGSIGCIFYFSLNFVEDFRKSNPWMLYLLPIDGLLIVFLYHLSHVVEPRGTNLILTAICCEETEPPARMAPLIFISTTLTHLFGGSAGREGAALQLGGSLGNFIGNILQFDDKSKNIVIMCGMSAAFTAIFGTPIAATIFAMELISVGIMYYSALVPCAIASIVAYAIAGQLGIKPESYNIISSPAYGFISIVQVLVLAVLCAGISIVLCYSLQNAGKSYKKYFPNPYLRIFAGGIFVIGLTWIFQTHDYLGLGKNIIVQAIDYGMVRPEAFVLKILFTAVTLGAGFKGGEIVPAFFVGATFGCAVGSLLGLPPSFAAAIGLIAVFCGVTNCPMTALIMSFELFNFTSPLLFLIATGVSYMLSGYYSLYSTQKIMYDKLKPQYINRKTH
ncbi:chloride channel protein [Anaerovorax odorimutans]|uniref:chloride channel protein n=1 Tax=Anaerovorax odorimutans TaxID=109327 RepID=UPI00042A7CA2|nr:chloride channel protein [Anaerovorax odorimutans]